MWVLPVPGIVVIICSNLKSRDTDETHLSPAHMYSAAFRKCRSVWTLTIQWSVDDVSLNPNLFSTTIHKEIHTSAQTRTYKYTKHIQNIHTHLAHTDPKTHRYTNKHTQVVHTNRTKRNTQIHIHIHTPMGAHCLIVLNKRAKKQTSFIFKCLRIWLLRSSNILPNFSFRLT